MVIFHSYVSLPEGKSVTFVHESPKNMWLQVAARGEPRAVEAALVALLDQDAQVRPGEIA